MRKSNICTKKCQLWVVLVVRTFFKIFLLIMLTTQYKFENVLVVKIQN